MTLVMVVSVVVCGVWCEGNRSPTRVLQVTDKLDLYLWASPAAKRSEFCYILAATHQVGRAVLLRETKNTTSIPERRTVLPFSSNRGFLFVFLPQTKSRWTCFWRGQKKKKHSTSIPERSQSFLFLLAINQVERKMLLRETKQTPLIYPSRVQS